MSMCLNFTAPGPLPPVQGSFGSFVRCEGEGVPTGVGEGGGEGSKLWWFYNGNVGWVSKQGLLSTQ